MTDETKDQIQIVIVDDHPVVREGLAGMLAGQADFAIAGLAANGAEAITLDARLRPDVILMDLRMPELDGVGAILAIKKQRP